MGMVANKFKSFLLEGPVPTVPVEWAHTVVILLGGTSTEHRGLRLRDLDCV